MMVKSSIEVIFEECGWVFNEEEDSWRLSHFKVSRAKLQKQLEIGAGKALRKKIVDTLNKAKGVPEIDATVERLRPRKKK